MSQHKVIIKCYKFGLVCPPPIKGFSHLLVVGLCFSALAKSRSPRLHTRRHHRLEPTVCIPLTSWGSHSCCSRELGDHISLPFAIALRTLKSLAAWLASYISTCIMLVTMDGYCHPYNTKPTMETRRCGLGSRRLRSIAVAAVLGRSRLDATVIHPVRLAIEPKWQMVWNGRYPW